jgi:hypothetical protein
MAKKFFLLIRLSEKIPNKQFLAIFLLMDITLREKREDEDKIVKGL